MLLEYAALPEGLRKVVIDYRNQLKAELDDVESFLVKANRGWNVVEDAPAKRKRGRPAKNGHELVPLMSASTTSAASEPKRTGRTFTAAQRAEQAARMKRYWAKRRKQAK